jgi:RND family efflux transporter MFP subunit
LHARDEANLAFRLAGKIVDRYVNPGDHVKAGQVIARLDAEIEHSQKVAAEADVTAAQAVVDQTAALEKRMADLLSEKAVSKTEYENAERQKKTAVAQLNAAKAKLAVAEEQLGYTTLKADADGVITAKNAEPGEVVRAGQPIVALAREDGRDAIFDMPSQLIRDGLTVNQKVEVRLADNDDVVAQGTIREIAPEADMATRAHLVKVTLVNPPDGMYLGSTLTGRFMLQAKEQIEIPASALAMNKKQASVWVIDEPSGTVHLKPIKVARYLPSTVLISEGLQSGDRVVTAGVHVLYEGQQVRVLEVAR